MKVAKIFLKHIKNGLLIECSDKRVLKSIEMALCRSVLESNKEFLMGCNLDD